MVKFTMFFQGHVKEHGKVYHVFSGSGKHEFVLTPSKTLINPLGVGWKEAVGGWGRGEIEWSHEFFTALRGRWEEAWGGGERRRG